MSPMVIKGKSNPYGFPVKGLTEDYIRLSVGIEHIDDITEDIDQALQTSAKR